MFIFWNEVNNVKRKANPIKVRRKCSNCNNTAFFYECEKVEEFKLYGIINLKDKRTIVMQCGECLGVYKAEDDPELIKEFEKREENKKNKELAEREKRKEERQIEAAKKQKELEKQKKEKQKEIDQELEQLKKELEQ